jgi:putative transposase
MILITIPLRFQIEFIFRDAKQHWGLEDFMNVKEKAVHNFANLSTFMVNFSYGIRREFGNEKMSIINLKARFHGLKYLNEIIKLLPQKPDAILMNTLYQKITAIGVIDEEKRVA